MGSLRTSSARGTSFATPDPNAEQAHALAVHVTGAEPFSKLEGGGFCKNARRPRQCTGGPRGVHVGRCAHRAKLGSGPLDGPPGLWSRGADAPQVSAPSLPSLRRRFACAKPGGRPAVGAPPRQRGGRPWPFPPHPWCSCAPPVGQHASPVVAARPRPLEKPLCLPRGALTIWEGQERRGRRAESLGLTAGLPAPVLINPTPGLAVFHSRACFVHPPRAPRSPGARAPPRAPLPGDLATEGSTEFVASRGVATGNASARRTPPKPERRKEKP